MYSHFWYLWKVNTETDIKLHIPKGKLSRKLLWFRLDASPTTTSYNLNRPLITTSTPRDDMWNTMPFLSPEDGLILHSLPRSVTKVKPALLLKIKKGKWKQYILMVWWETRNALDINVLWHLLLIWPSTNKTRELAARRCGMAFTILSFDIGTQGWSK